MRKATGKLSHLIPSKTVTLVHEFAVEDLLGQNYNLGSCICNERPALGQNTLTMMILEQTQHLSSRLGVVTCKIVDGSLVDLQTWDPIDKALDIQDSKVEIIVGEV